MRTAMGIRLVVTDMDNTLYSWVDYIVPAVEALTDAVTRATGHTRLSVIQALKEVYTRYESNEYPFALQESRLFEAFPDFGSFDKLVIEPARVAFANARRKYLVPYKGVMDTLSELRARQVLVVALTDAPKNPAQQRARLLGLDAHFAAMFTMPGFTFPRHQDGTPLVESRIVEKQEAGAYETKCEAIALPREWEKPSTLGLERILKTYGLPPSQVLVVGDSLKKDIAIAQATGCHHAWAEYGTYVPTEYRERLDIVSSPAITRRHAAHVLEAGAQPIAPTHALSNFAQVLELVERLG